MGNNISDTGNQGSITIFSIHKKTTAGRILYFLFGASAGTAFLFLWYFLITNYTDEIDAAFFYVNLFLLFITSIMYLVGFYFGIGQNIIIGDRERGTISKRTRCILNLRTKEFKTAD